MLDIKQVRTEAEHDAALARIDDSIHSASGSPQEAELDRISDPVIAYEDEHYPMGDASPHAMLEFMLDQQMVSREQLVPLAGGADALNGMLAGQKAITPELALILHKRFAVSMENLLPDLDKASVDTTSD